ncbi:MAG: hypothetical protein ACK5KQ_07195 [Anaerorhabdus sp.]
MSKLNIFNITLISNKYIDKIMKFPMWVAIISLLASVILVSAPIIIRSNQSLEQALKNNPEIIEALSSSFTDGTTCAVTNGKLNDCESYENKVNNILVSVNKMATEETSLNFTENKLTFKFKDEKSNFEMEMPYTFDFEFNDLSNKEITSIKIFNDLIASNQFANVINGLSMMSLQCLLYIFIGMITMYSSGKYQAKKKFSILELFKTQAIIGLSGAVLSFIICFIIDPFIAYSTTIYLFALLIRNFGIITKMKTFTF